MITLCSVTFLVACESPVVHSVTFYDEDNQVLVVKETFHGESIEVPQAPAKEGYVFKGWDKSLENITSDLAVRPVYERQTYLVRFETDEGILLQEMHVAHGDTIEPPIIPLKEGFEAAWDINIDRVYQSQVIQAVYTLKTYEVIFSNSDGTVIDNMVVPHGTMIDWTPPAITAPYGYKHKGWLAEGVHFQENMLVTQSYTFQPHLERKQIFIEDQALQEALRGEGYELSELGMIDYLVAQDISTLSLKNRGINSLIGFESFKNLTFLNISNNNLETLSPLLNLEHLEVVKVANNRLPFSHLSTTEETYDLTELRQLRNQGVQVQNAYFQQVIPHVKTGANTEHTWRVLMVLAVDVDLIVEGQHIVSTVDDHVIALAIHYARIFENAVNHLAPNHVLIEVDFMMTESVHHGLIEVREDHAGNPMFFLFAEHLDEIHERLYEYDSVMVLHHLKDNEGFAGLGGFDWDHFIGTASIRFESFEAVHDDFFGYEQVALIDKMASDYIDWGTMVLINEFIHGLDFYAIYQLGLEMNHQYDMVSYYEASIVDDYGQYDFDRSLTRDYLRLLGHLRGQANDAGTLVGLLDMVWGQPPRHNKP